MKMNLQNNTVEELYELKLYLNNLMENPFLNGSRYLQLKIMLREIDNKIEGLSYY